MLEIILNNMVGCFIGSNYVQMAFRFDKIRYRNFLVYWVGGCVAMCWWGFTFVPSQISMAKQMNVDSFILIIVDNTPNR